MSGGSEIDGFRWIGRSAKGSPAFALFDNDRYWTICSGGTQGAKQELQRKAWSQPNWSFFPVTLFVISGFLNNRADVLCVLPTRRERLSEQLVTASIYCGTSW